MNLHIRTGEDFVNFRPLATDDLTKEDVTKLRNELMRLYDEASGKETSDVCNFEITVILAYKD